MQWGKYPVLRPINTLQKKKFDPQLLIKIPKGHYKKAYKILVRHNNLHCFVMPIARYFDSENNEYVLIHAPDDRNKCFLQKNSNVEKPRLYHKNGVPFTLELESIECQNKELSHFRREIKGLKPTAHIMPKDIWHMDNRFKLNLFTLDL